MRRKSERAVKKAKSAPEEKAEKPKRTRSKRGRKQSSSTEKESDEDGPAPQQTPVKQKSPVKQPAEESSEDKPDQVWQVKTDATSDSGEIKKLKICLARPPSTPERVDKSPRSKRKHSRTTSSSDTTSETPEEKKKTKHRSKRGRDSRDDSEKNQDSQGEDVEKEPIIEVSEEAPEPVHTSTSADEVPMSTTDELKDEPESLQLKPADVTIESNTTANLLVADTTVESSNNDTQESQKDTATSTETTESNTKAEKDEAEKSVENERSPTPEEGNTTSETSKQQDESENEVEVELQISHREETKINEGNCSPSKDLENQDTEKGRKVVTAEKVVERGNSPENVEIRKRERRWSHKEARQKSTDSDKDKTLDSDTHNHSDDISKDKPAENGPSVPFVMNRKRKWGTRPNKLTTQKSITISTDILKDIIPDVKPTEFDEVIENKKPPKPEKVHRPILPKIVIDNTPKVEYPKRRVEEYDNHKDTALPNRKVSIVKENAVVLKPLSPPRHKSSSILYISNLVRPFTLPQLKNLLQRTGRIVEDGFWIDKIKSKCFVKYENEDQATETRHALHGVTWPISNPKTLQVDFSSDEAFEKAKSSELNSEAPVSTLPGTVEDWLREQDLKKERGEVEKPWQRKIAVREWDVGKGEKVKDTPPPDIKPERRHHRTLTPEPAKKFKKTEEAPAKLLDDLFKKTKATPCIYWLPLSNETIAIKEEQRRQHMAEHERRMMEIRRQRRH